MSFTLDPLASLIFHSPSWSLDHKLQPIILESLYCDSFLNPPTSCVSSTLASPSPCQFTYWIKYLIKIKDPELLKRKITKMIELPGKKNKKD